MMNRIEETFKKLKVKGEKALVGFVTAGDPSFDISFEIVKVMCEKGVDIIELGVPFSDPTADGPVIQRSSMRSLKNGMNLRKVLTLAEKIRKVVDTPLVLFSYYNPLFKFGGGSFYRRALDIGVDGVLIVDLPPEESKEFTSLWEDGSSRSLLSLIRLVAPTTPSSRIKEILRDGSGFVYLISKTGVTGSEDILPSGNKSSAREGESDNLDYASIEEMVASVRSFTSLPICVGFGISTPFQAAKVAKRADGVVIGSAFEKAIEEHLTDPRLIEIVGLMASRFKKGMVEST